MKLAKLVLAGSVFTVISAAALAQQARTGTITIIDRINGTVAIQLTPEGTVGTTAGAAAEQFKAQAGLLEKVHAGDKVTFSISDTAGAKTITKIEKQ